MLYNHRLSPSSSSADLLEEFEKDSKILNAEYVRRRNRALLYSLLLCSIFFAGLLVGFAGIKIPNAGPINVCAVDTLHVANTCRDATLRREWRSLDTAEKMDYIRAVKCLKTLPSQLQLNQSLYDDFPWVHKRFGEYAHDAAPFLAWHRYFIHTYERKLKEQCDYQGHLTYWDWTLDWENITMSPVWDADTGFGGSGNVEVDSPILKAHCVTEGAFANLEVLYFEDIYKPHCLLRGFDGNLEDFRGELEPTSVMKLLLSPDYGSINLGLEHGPHVAIPKSVNGDFSLHTAPSGERSSHTMEISRCLT